MILLFLPLADLTLLLPLSRLGGGWIWLWVLAGAMTGLLLLRGARDSIRRQWTGRSGMAGLDAMLDNGRTVLAGLLFLWPGPLTDVAAFVLLFTAPPAPARANWEHPLMLPGRRLQSVRNARMAQTQT
ncbi:MAG: FxsA family protein [Pseudomonadota bacterium]|nr:FxsA family protein [Pseudomonadota bacterium]